MKYRAEITSRKNPVQKKSSLETITFRKTTSKTILKTTAKNPLKQHKKQGEPPMSC